MTINFANRLIWPALASLCVLACDSNLDAELDAALTVRSATDVLLQPSAAEDDIARVPGSDEYVRDHVKTRDLVTRDDLAVALDRAGVLEELDSLVPVEASAQRLPVTVAFAEELKRELVRESSMSDSAEYELGDSEGVRVEFSDYASEINEDGQWAMVVRTDRTFRSERYDNEPRPTRFYEELARADYARLVHMFPTSSADITIMPLMAQDMEETEDGRTITKAPEAIAFKAFVIPTIQGLRLEHARVILSYYPDGELQKAVIHGLDELTRTTHLTERLPERAAVLDTLERAISSHALRYAVAGGLEISARIRNSEGDLRPVLVVRGIVASETGEMRWSEMDVEL